MNPIDQNIIEGCKRSDPRSQRQLYEYCFNDMLKVCMLYTQHKEDAAALYNEAMFKVFTHLKQNKDPQALSAWIRRIVVNTAIDHCRKNIKEVVYPVDITETKDVFVPPDIYDKISAEECLQLLKQIPPVAALVFNLFVVEGYKHEEISQLLNIPVGTSKWQLNEARKLLKQKLEAIKNTKTYSNVI